MAEEYDIEKVRMEFIGKELGSTAGKYPVEYEPIRRHCQMVGCVNPLFLDEEYAKKTRYKGVISFPTAVPMFAAPGRTEPVKVPVVPALEVIPRRGDGVINMSQELIFSKPVHIGDRLAAKTRIVDIFKKSIRLDPEAIWVTFESIMTNQKGEVVCTLRNTILNYKIQIGG